MQEPCLHYQRPSPPLTKGLRSPNPASTPPRRGSPSNRASSKVDDMGRRPKTPGHACVYRSGCSPTGSRCRTRRRPRGGARPRKIGAGERDHAQCGEHHSCGGHGHDVRDASRCACKEAEAPRRRPDATGVARTLGRMRTCGFDYLQYDGLGTPYGPTAIDARVTVGDATSRGSCDYRDCGICSRSVSFAQGPPQSGYHGRRRC